MRKLIYATVSRTPVYRQMLCLMVKSLRGRGRYTGDIHIMCNLVDGLEEIAELVTFLLVNPQCGVKDERMEGLSFIDPSLYDVILNLDCDILAFNDIAPLFEDVDGVRYFDEPWGFINQGEQMYDYYFSPEEKRRYAWAHTINAGHFAVSGRWMIPMYMQWKQTLQSKPHVNIAGSDQAALNAIIRRGLVPAKPWARGLVRNGMKDTRESWMRSCVTHFAGLDSKRLAIMQEMSR